MEDVKDTRKNYLLDQMERSLKQLKSETNLQHEKLNEDIADANLQINLIEKTIIQL